MGDRSKFDGYIQEEKDDLIAKCGFTERERAIFEQRAKGKSVVETRFALHLSERTIVRDSAKIRTKIARVQHRRRDALHACEEYAR